MPKNKSTYVDLELEWAEKQLSEWKDYVNSHPINKLRDRYDVEGKRVVSRIEDQSTHIQGLLKNYLSLLKEVDLMREKEEQKEIKIRGKDNLNPLESGEI